MSGFIVSARKYRPSTFDEVVGQAHISTTLKNALKNNQLAQSFLFCGPRGVGKTTCARILAKTINCTEKGENLDPCGTCNSCTSFQNNSSFNIHELDAASNNSVEDIRSLIEQVRIPPQNGNYKVYIIDEVHMLSSSAFNAFLKTLEEPPSYAVFILATTEKHKIIPTILSRCQIFDFKRIQVQDIVGHLESICTKENISAENDALHIIGEKADGALRDALSIFDRVVSFSNNDIKYKEIIENLNILDYAYYFNLTKKILANDIKEVLLLFDQVLGMGFDGDHFLNGMAVHFRNLLVAKDPKTVVLIESSENLKQQYLAQSSSTNIAFLISALDLINKFDNNYKSSNNKRLHVEMCLMKLTFINKITSADANFGTVSEKKTPITSETTAIKTSKQAEEQQIAIEKEEISIQKVETPVIKESAPSISKTPKISGFNLDSLTQQVSETITKYNPSDALKTIDELWKDLVIHYSEKEPAFSAALKDIHSKEIKGNNVYVVVDTIMKKSALEEQKHSFYILNFLRKELKNPDLVYDIFLDEALKPQSGAKPATSREKFMFLAEKNPNLALLKKSLGMEIDF